MWQTPPSALVAQCMIYQMPSGEALEARMVSGHLYVLEVKHVSLHKGLFDFLVSPRDEQLIIMVSL